MGRKSRGRRPAVEARVSEGAGPSGKSSGEHPAGRAARAFPLAVLAILAAGIALAYSNVLDAPFVFDDADSIEENDAIHVEEISVAALRAAAVAEPYSRRPVANVTFALNHRAGGLDTRGYHVVNLAVHVGSAVALYLFLSILLGLHEGLSRPREIAAAVALLWALHPIQTESVTYITQRMTSLSGFFYLWGLVAYLAARRGGGRRRWIFFALSGLAFLLALGTKENAAVFPIAIILVEWLFLSRGEGAGRRLAWIAGAGLLAAILVVLVLPGVRAIVESSLDSLWTGEDLPDRKFGARGRLLTQSRVVLWYLSLVAFPAPERLNLDHDVAHSTSLFEPVTTGLSIVVLVALLAAVVRLRRTAPLVAFAIVWYGLHLAIESSILGLELAFEHRLYLPSVAPVLLAVLALWRIAGKVNAPARAAFLLGLAGLLGYATHVRNDAWKSRLSLYRDSAMKSPGKVRAQSNLAAALAKEGRIEEALASFERVLEIDPDHPAALANLGHVLVELGRYHRAVEVLERAARVAPSPDVYDSLGLARGGLGDHASAARAFRKALFLDPGDAEFHFHLGVALVRLNQVAEAALAFGNACRLREDYVEAQNAYAAALGDLGRLEEAVEVFRAILARHPSLVDVRLNLAATCERTGDLPEAAEIYEGLVAGGPPRAEVHARLARIYALHLLDPVARRKNALRALELDPRHPDRADLSRWAGE